MVVGCFLFLTIGVRTSRASFIQLDARIDKLASIGRSTIVGTAVTDQGQVIRKFNIYGKLVDEQPFPADYSLVGEDTTGAPQFVRYPQILGMEPARQYRFQRDPAYMLICVKGDTVLSIGAPGQFMISSIQRGNSGFIRSFKIPNGWVNNGAILDEVHEVLAAKLTTRGPKDAERISIFDIKTGAVRTLRGLQESSLHCLDFDDHGDLYVVESRYSHTSNRRDLYLYRFETKTGAQVGQPMRLPKMEEFSGEMRCIRGTDKLFLKTSVQTGQLVTLPHGR